MVIIDVKHDQNGTIDRAINICIRRKLTALKPSFVLTFFYSEQEFVIVALHDLASSDMAQNKGGNKQRRSSQCEKQDAFVGEIDKA